MPRTEVPIFDPSIDPITAAWAQSYGQVRHTWLTQVRVRALTERLPEVAALEHRACPEGILR